MRATTRKPRGKYNKYTKYVPTYDYSQVDNWSMGKEEASALIREANKRFLAGDEDGFFEVSKKIPLAPNIALMMRDDMGKEALLAEGCNLADAEIVFGKDWLDNYMVDDDE